MTLIFGGTIDWLIFISFVISLTYVYLYSKYNFWKKKRVPFVKPSFLFGNSFCTLAGIKHAASYQQELYNQFPNDRFYGIYNLTSPTLIIKDPDLVEIVLIKDFAHFYNRGIKVDGKLDRLSQHLVNLEDKKWKSLRYKLTPVFTSGKLKTMHHQFIDCSDSLIDILHTYASSGRPFEAREVMSNFTTEVIGHCAFGLEMNSLKNPDSEFRRMGREFFRPSSFNIVRRLIRKTCPTLLRYLNWKQVPYNVEQFFIDAIKDTMALRESSNVEIHDFLQLLINLQKEDQKLIERREEGLSDNDEVLMDDVILTSNAMVFFLAGFETTASTLASCLFELSQNPHIQEKLREDVKCIVAEHNGLPTFDAVKNIPYLDQVITETLRKHPPVVAVPRECCKDWTIPGTDTVITKGTMIEVPIYSLHHDLNHYPQPEKFIPERFAEENKHHLKKGTFLAFGDGPRICIGNRFAKQEMKVALATMMLKCRFTVNAKTKVPLEFNPKSVFLVPKGGIWLNVEKI